VLLTIPSGQTGCALGTPLGVGTIKNDDLPIGRIDPTRVSANRPVGESNSSNAWSGRPSLLQVRLRPDR
jgi:hypothetical protein